MTRRTELTLSVDVAAPPQQVWDALVDWPRQGEWMLGTRVRGTVQGGHGVGGGIEAFTGVGRIGFLDTMVITEWEPPRRCVVDHTGRVVRGEGIFAVEPDGPDRSRIIWSELLDLPLGALGRAGWVLVRPIAALGVRLSLKRLARLLEKR